jgi:hypothetical protein
MGKNNYGWPCDSHLPLYLGLIERGYDPAPKTVWREAIRGPAVRERLRLETPNSREGVIWTRI